MSALANVWSFISTLVRSLLALFSFRRGASDPFSLPRVNHTPDDALARAHARLRPILLTPRSPAYHAQRIQGTRTAPATSTLFSGHSDNTATSAPVSQTGQPQRTSPKLDPPDAEFGLSVAVCELPGHPAASATSLREGTPDTSGTGSSYVLPLTPPDKCYLAPLPSATDCPYTEAWPVSIPLDRGKPRCQASPLRVSINTNHAFPEPMVGPIGSPPPGRWDPVQIWTSTPCNNDGPELDPFDHHMEPSLALADISRAIVLRSQGSIQPYDDAANSSASSDASPFIDGLNGSLAGPTRDNHRAQAHVTRSKNQPFRRFHHPDAYACTWRRHPVRLPGKRNRTHAYTRSHSYMDLPASGWYDANAYAPSPVTVLSPPRCDSATEDEDEMPLCCLRERLVRRSAAVDASVGFGIPLRKAADMSPHTRRMSEGCLLAMSQSTPTRVGMGARSDRQVFSMALDGDGFGTQDWLPLRFSSKQRGTLAQESGPDAAVPVDVVAG